jgi:hypothetical protein
MFDGNPNDHKESASDTIFPQRSIPMGIESKEGRVRLTRPTLLQ